MIVGCQEQDGSLKMLFSCSVDNFVDHIEYAAIKRRQNCEG